VYPVVGGPRFEVGYVLVRVDIPPEPVPGNEEPEDGASVSEYWESAPESASASEAELAEPVALRSKDKIEHRHFRWIQCIEVGDAAGDAPLKRPGGSCGNPFAGEEGAEDIAFSYGIRGDYYRVLGDWVKHRGSSTAHIECAKKNNVPHWDKGAVIEPSYFIDPAQRCEWYGKTRDGGGAFVEHGEHLTPYGEWNWGIGGSTHWNIRQAGLALYIWAASSGHVGHHKTTCIDCY
jgi:hypothetical protein